ncbi:hypothetical protein PtrSN002B_008914 [Pyrenophora tritici-repentis]|uniref:Uncharacterized protein n=2 Tax=Pyrenophora tritici-repentis TaxID=45151 RepID=A0A2W1FCW1_9PLEO|nr:uncharacterized protein PTRG_09595 [Pyrenophora tritici-repentis Pt-1C-BFP]KAA8617773.1 hypothetical protein PtrV1_09280 [Pyrenophora tritici-repentis]EDU42646.1 predicted protein [Pyrenophora tritici-repentis Pt-1C-BFP]KAF7443276.1 hypothetical protein A1F99_127830 [Pyrenophora tritici-repentis]KAF7568246.1 hypothetical protein PtrM4_128590 [Pyrenophora tritici-repentis]KAG9377035.1 hypothetical protein A1F94_012635 [Pyrenophora tritici-repentis]
MFRYYHAVASMLAVSLANVVFNIPDSTPGGTDTLTSGVDIVEIRWPEHLVFSPPATTTYGDLYLITKEDERMVARIKEAVVFVGLNESFTYTLPPSNESQALMFCIIATSKPGTSIYNATESRALSRSFIANPSPSSLDPTTPNSTTSTPQSSASHAHAPIPTNYGYTKLSHAEIAMITLSSLLIIVLIVMGIIVLDKKKRGGPSKKRAVIEIAGTPVPHKHGNDDESELPARLTRQGF